MNTTTTGWITFITALGMMCGLISSDIGKLTAWGQAIQPSFVAVVMAHFGAVVVAFVGGKLIPADRDPNLRSRSEDKVSEATLNNINQKDVKP